MNIPPKRHVGCTLSRSLLTLANLFYTLSVCLSLSLSVLGNPQAVDSCCLLPTLTFTVSTVCSGYRWPTILLVGRYFHPKWVNKTCHRCFVPVVVSRRPNYSAKLLLFTFHHLFTWQLVESFEASDARQTNDIGNWARWLWRTARCSCYVAVWLRRNSLLR